MSKIWILLRDERGYMDIGVTSLLIQFLVGVLVSIPLLVVVFRHRLVNLWRRIKK